jgi:C4-dicarboxylate transporter, DctM subunit
MIIAAALTLLALGVPVVFTFGLATIAMALVTWPGTIGLSFLALNTYSVITTDSLIAIPLFVFMAEVVMFSGLGTNVFDGVQRLLGRIPGGLASSSMVSCIGFAAITGSSAANTATVGSVAVGEMLKRGYDKRLAVGSIAAGGALGILIPPSTFMVVYGVLTDTSIVDLFIAGVIPGLMLGGAMLAYIVVRSVLDPALAPPVRTRMSRAVLLRACIEVLPLLALALGMIGAIYAGIATPNEIAALGVLGALLLAATQARLSLANLYGALVRAVTTSSMIFWIMIGTWSFGFILNHLGVGEMLATTAKQMDLSVYAILLVINLLLFVLGMFLDPGAILMLVTPIALPLLKAANIDLIWFGIIFTLNMEMGMITPPFGMNLFIMKGISPPSVSMWDIVVGAAPFILIEIVAIIIIVAWPQLALWLPGKIG